MNANKMAKKTKKAYKADIKSERSLIKAFIDNASIFCRAYAEKEISHNENLEWLKRKGFEITKVPDTNHTYKISWEHKL